MLGFSKFGEQNGDKRTLGNSRNSSNFGHKNNFWMYFCTLNDEKLQNVSYQNCFFKILGLSESREQNGEKRLNNFYKRFRFRAASLHVHYFVWRCL